jgi:hypothetical protein
MVLSFFSPREGKKNTENADFMGKGAVWYEVDVKDALQISPMRCPKDGTTAKSTRSR